jgi:hypothetical protein
MQRALSILASSLALTAIAPAITVAHWEFNDLTDSSGNGHTLTDGNTGATLNSGQMDFTNTSVSGLLSAADSSAWDDTSFTVEAILTVTSTTTLSSIVAHMTTGTPGRQWFFGTSETGVPLFIINPSSGAEARFTSSFTGLTSGSTYYVGASINLSAVNEADRITFYLRDLTTPDGAFQTSNVSTTFTGFASSTSVLTIGSTGHSTSRIAGSIDQVRISDTNLATNALLVSVPEPSHVMLSGLGIALLGIRRRRA